MKLGYMNSRKPSKPNLPNAPKPSKLFAPTRLCRTLSSLAYRIPQSPIASTKMNWSLLNCFTSTKIPPHWYGYGEIRIWQMYLSRICQWRGWEQRNYLVQHSKTKHIGIRYHFIRDLVERKIVALEYIPTERQNADIFTKPLDRSKFEALRLVIGVILCL